jgi:hypothetical protein
MAIDMTKFEINRWNCDDQAIAYLKDAHWNTFFAEPRYGKDGVESAKHKRWRMALRMLHRAADHLREHTPAFRLNQEAA